jgi:hypothetical protein
MSISLARQQQFGRVLRVITAFRLARWAGETPCFGWNPAELPAWPRDRGFAVLSDYADRALAATYFPPALAQDFPDRGGHVALCAPSAPTVLR